MSEQLYYLLAMTQTGGRPGPRLPHKLERPILAKAFRGAVIVRDGEVKRPGDARPHWQGRRSGRRGEE